MTRIDGTTLGMFGLEIVQNSARASSDEMFAATCEFAMGIVIHEVFNMTTAITSEATRRDSAFAFDRFSMDSTRLCRGFSRWVSISRSTSRRSSRLAQERAAPVASVVSGPMLEAAQPCVTGDHAID